MSSALSKEFPTVHTAEYSNVTLVTSVLETSGTKTEKEKFITAFAILLKRMINFSLADAQSFYRGHPVVY